MLANRYKKIKEKILNIVNENKYMVDIYTSGSVGRKEVRKEGGEIKSDIDIIVVYDDENEVEEIKKDFEAQNLSEKYNIEVGFVYCYVKNFISSELTDFVLSINFDDAIVKKLDYKYSSKANEQLSDDRWCYQLQSCVYYFCKHMIDRSLDSLSKVYLNLIKLNLYKNKIVKTNKYILNHEIGKYLSSDFVDVELYNASLLCLKDSIEYSKDIYDKIFVKVGEAFIKIFYIEDIKNKTNLLMSVSYFYELIKEYGMFNISKEKCQDVLFKVVCENTGRKDFSCIHIEKN